MTDISYKVSFAVECVDVVIGVAAFYYLSRVLGNRHPDGYDAFGFLLVGLAANNAMTTALTSLSGAVKLDQQSGALKPMMMAPTAPALLVAYGSVYPVVRSAASAAAFLFAGAIFGVAFGHANVLSAVVVSGLALAAFAALGLLSAASVLVLKRGDPIVWLFSALSWLLGGVFFPVAVLPLPLQRAASWLPITHALNALRAALLKGSTLAQLRGDIVILFAIAVLGFPAGLYLVHRGIERVKQTGTLSHV